MRQTACEQLIQEGIERGIEQGIERGIEQGIERGRILSCQKNIVLLLCARFNKVPSVIKKQIDSIQDLVILESLLIDASMCASLKEFRGKFL